jgi:hypothetical protein
MAEEAFPPSPSFAGIDFNPEFFPSSTIDYLEFPVAQGTETFGTIYVAKVDTLTPANDFDFLGSQTADINMGSSVASGNSITLGSSASSTTLNGTAVNVTTKLTSPTVEADFLDSVGSTLTLGSTNATSITTGLPLYVNSYYLTGTAPTLGKSSMNYFVNYASVEATYTTTGARYLYSPATNSSTSNSHYFQAGIYEMNIHVYVVQAGGPAFSGCDFTIGAAVGTATGAISTSAQYGTYTVSSREFSAGNPAKINLNGNGTTFSHTACLKLTASSFINLELYINALTAITSGGVTFAVYGCVKRIG